MRPRYRLDLLTTPYVFNTDQTTATVKAGADMLVSQVALTSGGTIGAGVALILDEAIDCVMQNAATGRKVNADLLVICHGGPFDEPQVVGQGLWN